MLQKPTRFCTTMLQRIGLQSDFLLKTFCFIFLSVILLIDNAQLVSGQCTSPMCDGFAPESSCSANQFYETDGIGQLISQAAETKADVMKLLTICQNVSTEIDKIDKQQQDAGKSLARQLNENQLIIRGIWQNLSSRNVMMEMMHRNSSTAIDRMDRQQQDATSRLVVQLNENQLKSQSRHQNLSSRIESISGRFDTLSSSISRTLEVYEHKMESVHQRLSFAMERFYKVFQLTTSQSNTIEYFNVKSEELLLFLL